MFIVDLDKVKHTYAITSAIPLLPLLTFDCFFPLHFAFF